MHGAAALLMLSVLALAASAPVAAGELEELDELAAAAQKLIHAAAAQSDDAMAEGGAEEQTDEDDVGGGMGGGGMGGGGMGGGGMGAWPASEGEDDREAADGRVSGGIPTLDVSSLTPRAAPRAGPCRSCAKLARACAEWVQATEEDVLTVAAAAALARGATDGGESARRARGIRRGVERLDGGATHPHEMELVLAAARRLARRNGRGASKEGWRGESDEEDGLLTDEEYDEEYDEYDEEEEVDIEAAAERTGAGWEGGAEAFRRRARQALLDASGPWTARWTQAKGSDPVRATTAAATWDDFDPLAQLGSGGGSGGGMFGFDSIDEP